MNPLPVGNSGMPSIGGKPMLPLPSALPSGSTDAKKKAAPRPPRANDAAPLHRAYPALLLASTTLAGVFCYLYLTKPVIAPAATTTSLPLPATAQAPQPAAQANPPPPRPSRPPPCCPPPIASPATRNPRPPPRGTSPPPKPPRPNSPSPPSRKPTCASSTSSPRNPPAATSAASLSMSPCSTAPATSRGPRPKLPNHARCSTTYPTIRRSPANSAPKATGCWPHGTA